MGDRGTIVVKEGPGTIYLYTHWGGSELKTTLRRALGREARWDDPAYLTRIIFCEMVKGHEADETGFGISTQPQDGEYNTLVVNTDSQTVTEGDGEAVPFREFVVNE